jgi:hypothetical protein
MNKIISIKALINHIRHRKYETLFVIMIIIYLIPIWRFPYFPTQDGPSHIHNTQVLKDFNNPEYKFGEHYKLNIKPFPNWINYIIMAGFQFIFSPIISEKLFLTIYVVMMAISIYYLLGVFGHKRRIFAFISFPFIYNYLFLMGFYNFAIAVPLMFFSIGYFWKYKDKINWKSGIILGLLPVLTYFSHPVPYILVISTIFILSVIYFKKRIRGIIYNLICLIPSIALFVNYAIYTGMTKAKRPPSSFWNMPRLLSDFVSEKSLVSFNTSEQTKIGYVIFGFIALMLIITIISKWRFHDGKLIINLEEKDYLIFGFIISFGLYIYAPDGLENQGGFINSRLNLLSSLFLIPLISENIGKIMRVIALVLMVIIAIGNFIYLYDYIDVLSFELEEYTAGVDKIGKNIVMMPLIFDKGGNSQLVQIFTHAPNYNCLDNGNINLGNYEAAIHYFPINFRDDFDRPTVSQVHYTPNEIDFAKLSTYVDYIVAFGYDKNITDKVNKYYDVIFTKDRLRIYKKK